MRLARRRRLTVPAQRPPFSTQPVGTRGRRKVYIDEGWEFGLSYLGDLEPDGARLWRPCSLLAPMIGPESRSMDAIREACLALRRAHEAPSGEHGAPAPPAKAEPAAPSGRP